MNIKTKGILFGIISAILWAFNSLLLTIYIQESVYFFAPLFFAFFHDIFSAFYLFLNIFRRKENRKQILSILRKKAFFIMFGAAILGGPIGMTSFLMASKYIGSSYASSISVLYPIAGAILGKLFFHESLNSYKKLAILLSILGISILSFTTEGLTAYPHYHLGIFFALLCVFGWAFEGLIASYFMTEINISSEVTIFIRQLCSSVFYILCILPFIGGFSMISLLIPTISILKIILLSAFLGAISYLFWYKAIDILGGPIGMLLNSSYVVWIVFLEILLARVQIELKFIITLVCILSSIFLLIKDSKGEKE